MPSSQESNLDFDKKVEKTKEFLETKLKLDDDEISSLEKKIYLNNKMNIGFKKYSSLRIKNSFVDFIIEELHEKSEHELTRSFISDKIDTLSSELAKKEDLIKTKDEIILNIKNEAEENRKLLIQQIEELRKELKRFLPYKRAFKVSLYFTLLFLFSFFTNTFLNIEIIKPFWETLGLFISGSFLLMSYFLYLDWNKRKAND